MDSVEEGTVLLAQIAGAASAGVAIDVAALREAADVITRTGLQLAEAVDVAERQQQRKMVMQGERGGVRVYQSPVVERRVPLIEQAAAILAQEIDKHGGYT